MLKGIGKHVVVLKNTGSELFEEAIFILKEGVHAKSDDVLTECRKIIRSSETGRSGQRGFSGKKKLLICTAMLSAAALILSIVLFFVL